MWVKWLVSIGSLSTILFGVWHFFVPALWHWYQYIDEQATELVIAVRAINIFFSLSLVLFGLLNFLIVVSGRANRFAVLVVLALTCLLWLCRVAMQVLVPQGSMAPSLQYGMLAAFTLIFSCYLVSFVIVLLTKV